MLRALSILLFFTVLFLFASCEKDSANQKDHSVSYPNVSTVGASEAFGVVWEEFSGNPIIMNPSCPAWNCLASTDPWVAKGPDNTNIIWFSTGGVLPLSKGYKSHGPIVGRAILDKNLKSTLNPSNKPVLDLRDDAWDKHRETVSTYWDQDQGNWIMWYLGYSISFFDDPGFGQIYSKDTEGISWTESQTPIYRPKHDNWDFAFITSPRFIKISDTEWRLYYTGAGTTVGIGVLLSYDKGETWEAYKHNPVFERNLDSWDQGLLGGSVLYHNNTYYMWYAGYHEPLDLETTPMYIGLATSTDGFNWERSPYNPVTGPSSPTRWDDLRIVSPHVIVDSDGSLLLFAHAQSMSNVQTSMGQVGIWRSPAYSK